MFKNVIIALKCVENLTKYRVLRMVIIYDISLLSSHFRALLWQDDEKYTKKLVFL